MRFSFLIILLIILGSSCINQSNEQPNILWISCEDISPAWGCYRDSLATTPHIDQLAREGFTFTQAFSNAPICAPARSTLITGMYATSLGTQNLRSEIPIPKDLKILPEILREHGYYTTNNAKTDYNFSHVGRWDESSNNAHWRNKPEGKPFFSVFNFGITHEGHANTYKEDDLKTLDQRHQPGKMDLPPYFPETDEFKSIFANQYDLITVFDQEVGKLIDQLKQDGLYENTIIFVFSDHGYGLPRYKRWLYNSGLQVPFVLHAPAKFRHLVSNIENPLVSQKVGFVDFAPTVLNLAGISPMKKMEGSNFLGNKAISKDYIFGFRDRADDVYDMSRSVYDGQFLYIRNYMPHKPYIQNAVIFNRGKRSYEELFRVKKEGKLSDETSKLFNPKPVEELYDLQNDPYELSNLIDNPKYQGKASNLHEVLKDHLIKTHDTGLLNEGDMMVRAADKSVFEMARQKDLFDVESALQAAELVGKIQQLDELDPYFENKDAAVRFWALQALDAFEGDISSKKEIILKLMNDPSVINQALAAEILINKYEDDRGIGALKTCLKTDVEPVLLQVAISVRNIGENAAPLIPFIKNEIYPNISGEVWGRYKNWMYPMFIGMALDQTLENCGKEVNIQN